MQHFYLSDHGKRVVSAVAFGVSLIGINLWLAGCGGGAAAVASGGTGGTRAAISGTVVAPADVSRAAKERTRGELVPVSDGTVTLVNLDNGQTEGTTSTNSAGQYSFETAHANTNYEIRCTKAVTGGTMTLSAIVSTDSDTMDGTETRPLNPDSTVAAVVAKTQAEAIKAADPTAAVHDLASIANEMETKRKEIQAPPPDLTKTESVASAGTELKQEVVANGSYIGTAVGGKATLRLGALIKDGKFFVLGIPEKTAATTGGSKKAQTRAADDPKGNGDNKGNNSGSGQENQGSGGGPHNNGDGTGYAFGTVTPEGVLSAHTKDGTKLTGVFVGKVGKGIWTSPSGESGTWSLAKTTGNFAGLYVGTHTGRDSGESHDNTGAFAALLLDDGSFFLAGDDAQSDGMSVIGTGTYTDASVLTITFANGDGGASNGTTTATAEIHGDELSGTWSSSKGGRGTWNGTRREVRLDLLRGLTPPPAPKL